MADIGLDSDGEARTDPPAPRVETQRPGDPISPVGEFMTPLSFTLRDIATVPEVAGCYWIYVDAEPFYAGMSRCNMRRRLRAHASGRGSRAVFHELGAGRRLSFEYCAVDHEMFAHAGQDIERAESWFMLLHTGEPLRGNRKLDGLSLVGSRDRTKSNGAN